MTWFRPVPKPPKKERAPRPPKVRKRVKQGPPWEWCPRCDGCGWYEGGKTLQTECEQCKGTGKIKGAK